MADGLKYHEIAGQLFATEYSTVLRQTNLHQAERSTTALRFIDMRRTRCNLLYSQKIHLFPRNPHLHVVCGFLILLR
jgi:hypothetical protein